MANADRMRRVSFGLIHRANSLPRADHFVIPGLDFLRLGPIKIEAENVVIGFDMLEALFKERTPSR